MPLSPYAILREPVSLRQLRPVIKATVNELCCTKSNIREFIKVKKKKTVAKAVVLKSLSSYVGRTRFHILNTFVELRTSSSWQPDLDTHRRTLSLTLGFCRSLTILVQLSHSAALSLNFQTVSGFDQQRLPLFHPRPQECHNHSNDIQTL